MSYIDIVLLTTLAHEPTHGYELRRRVESFVMDAVTLNPNVLYPALHRFEEMGAVTMTVEPQEGRPPRHVYHLTERGHEVIGELLRDFGPAQARDAAEFTTRVALFHLLDRDDRTAILDARSQVLTERRGQLTRGYGYQPPEGWSTAVMTHTLDEVNSELAWIDELRERARTQ